jgi:TonB family protein
MTCNRRVLAVSSLLAITACPSPDTTKQAMDSLIASAQAPDQLPVMRNQELPFRYPDALYATKVQANVILHIYIDTAGMVWPESTVVQQSSGYAAFDSAAVRGAPQLRFLPAKLKGKPVGVGIRLPVYFRHPAVPPPPGDSVLRPKPGPVPKP